MPFVQAKCPECGGMLAVDADKKAAVCQFCGEAFIVQEAINNYNTYNETINNYNTTHQYGEGAVVNVYEDQSKDFVIEAGVLKEYHGESVDVVIPDNVYEIGAGAFKGKKIRSITLHSKITEIGEGAFSGCANLASIDIPNNTTEIGPNAFEGCSSLTNITIPNGVKAIGSRAFSGCRSLINARIPETVKYIKYPNQYEPVGCLFENCSELKSVTIPADILGHVSNAHYFIGEGSYDNFCGCKNLKNIEILYTNSDNLSLHTVLEKEMIQFVKAVHICRDVTVIGSYAFFGCTGLTSITIPDGVTKVFSSAFSGCTSLASVTIPDSVTEIGHGAFAGCPKLVDIKMPSNITLRDYAFRSYWEQKGLCGKCGGNFNLFNKCKKCGMKKDY